MAPAQPPRPVKDQRLKDILGKLSATVFGLCVLILHCSFRRKTGKNLTGSRNHENLHLDSPGTRKSNKKLSREPHHISIVEMRGSRPHWDDDLESLYPAPTRLRHRQATGYAGCATPSTCVCVLDAGLCTPWWEEHWGQPGKSDEDWTEGWEELRG